MVFYMIYGKWSNSLIIRKDITFANFALWKPYFFLITYRNQTAIHFYRSHFYSHTASASRSICFKVRPEIAETFFLTALPLRASKPLRGFIFKRIQLSLFESPCVLISA